MKPEDQDQSKDNLSINSTTYHTGPFLVYSEKCSTCIFGPDSPISMDTFKQIKDLWQREDRVQECHVATYLKKRVACRGYLEAYIKGAVQNKVLDEACRLIGLPEGLDREAALRVLEHLGYIQFEELALDQEAFNKHEAPEDEGDEE